MSDATPTGVKTDPDAFRDQVCEYLHERRRDGYEYVTATDVEERFGVTSQRAGKNLAMIYSNRDLLSMWNDPDTNGSNTYRIELGGSDE